MSDSSSDFCTIPPNPDISGIGVRTAIYIQNFLGFVPAFAAVLDDQEVDQSELDSLETQSTTILILAFAILITAMVQVATQGLTNYHTTIVLSLSWMNNTNTFIYFLLWLHRKTKLAQGTYVYYPMGHLTWWLRMLRWPLEELTREYGNIEVYKDHISARNKTDHSGSRMKKKIFENFVTWRNRFVELFDPLSRYVNTVLLLGSLHLSLMSAVGIWLWSSPTTFGLSQPCTSNTSFMVLGQSTMLGSRFLRAGSLLIYAAFLPPVLNLFLPMGFITAMYMLFNRSRISKEERPSIHPVIIGLVILISINAIFIGDIETTIQRNQANQDGTEQTWSFGQILPLVLLLIPLRDVVEIVAGKQDRRRVRDLNETLLSVLNGGKTISQLLRKGANANIYGKSGINVLIMAAGEGDNEVTQAIFDNRKHSAVDINATSSGKYFTALYAACAEGHLEVVEALINRQADIDLEGGEYGSALGAAVYRGHTNIVKILLEYKAKVDIQGGEYGTALGLAAFRGNPEMVKLLIDHGADINTRAGKYDTALGVSVYKGNKDVMELLLRRGASRDIKGLEKDDFHHLQRHTLHDARVLSCVTNGLREWDQGDQLCYLITTPLPQSFEKVYEVTFEIQGHDQGWSAHDNKYDGTEVGSFTWFEAAIIKSCSETVPKWMETVIKSNPEYIHGPSASKSEDKSSQIGPRWCIATNLRATWATNTMKRIWTWSDEEPTSVERLPGEPHHQIEPYADFLRELKRGDRIALICRAEAVGWENHILSASIDVHYR